MKLSKKLKEWAVEQKLVKANDADDLFKKAIGAAIVSEALTPEKFAELSASEEAPANDVKTVLTQLAVSVNELKSVMQEDRAEKGSGKKKPPQVTPDAETPADETASSEEDESTDKPVKKTVTKPVEEKGIDMTKHEPSELEKMVISLSNPLAVENGEKALSVRVKEAAEQYSTTKSAMLFPTVTEKGRAHPMAGKPVTDYSNGHQIDTPSDLDKAVSGAFAKFLVNNALHKRKSVAFHSLPQHDRELLLYAMEKMPWGGTTNNRDDDAPEDIKHRRLTPGEQKALIDDAISGGLEAAPIVFDDQVITTPLLNGELFPLVKVMPIDRGRRVEGVATGTVTGSWGGVDDTAVSLFNTASYVSAFDTTIFRWEGSIRVGLDFLGDTPIDFGQHLTSQYGERLLEDLDDVVAAGNGTTQPEGVSVKSGTTSVNFGGSTTLGNYESLRFGVAKPEHRANVVSSAVFCGTETSYQRAKAIPVGASDARRLSNTGNMPSYSDYSWMGVPYKINESLANTTIFYAILARYRMYRRRGLSMRTSTEGDTLIRNNEMLIVAMARYGGQLERGAVAAVTTSAPA